MHYDNNPHSCKYIAEALCLRKVFVDLEQGTPPPPYWGLVTPHGFIELGHQIGSGNGLLTFQGSFIGMLDMSLESTNLRL